MKTKLLLCGMLLCGATLFAQAPQKFSYQAVVRNTSGTLVVSSAVGIRISLLQGSASGTAVYVETQTVNTNANGLLSMKIGEGTVVSGDMATIDWGNGPYFLKSETDPTGGTNYTIIGTTEMMSVPYALYAETSGTPGPQGPAGPAGSDGAAGPIGPTGPMGPAGADGATGATGAQGPVGATGAQGPAGATGAQGPAGATGAQGITSISNINGYLGGPITGSALAYVFAGPTQSVTITAGQKICGCASAPLSTTSGTATGVRVGLGYQQGAGVITNFVGGAYSIVEIGTERNPVPVSACITGLAAGTYTVGFVIQNGSVVPIDDNDYINGWFMVTN